MTDQLTKHEERLPGAKLDDPTAEMEMAARAFEAEIAGAYYADSRAAWMQPDRGRVRPHRPNLDQLERRQR